MTQVLDTPFVVQDSQPAAAAKDQAPVFKGAHEHKDLPFINCFVDRTIDKLIQHGPGGPGKIVAGSASSKIFSAPGTASTVLNAGHFELALAICAGALAPDGLALKLQQRHSGILQPVQEVVVYPVLTGVQSCHQEDEQA